MYFKFELIRNLGIKLPILKALVLTEAAHYSHIHVQLHNQSSVLCNNKTNDYCIVHVGGRLLIVKGSGMIPHKQILNIRGLYIREWFYQEKI